MSKQFSDPMPLHKTASPQTSSTKNLETENKVEFERKMAQSVAPFWQTRQEGKIIGKDGLRLYWCAFKKQEHKQAVVILNGRIEASIKYQELMFDLFEQGFDVYSLDHRGQGQSERLVVGSDIGHVNYFSDYAEDLHLFVEQIISRKAYQNRALLCHSMGGAIGLFYAKKRPNVFDAIILSAPMLGIEMPKPLALIAEPLSYFLAYFANPANFSFRQNHYKALPFSLNRTSGCKARYNWWQALYEQHPEIKVGGASNRWVWQALKTCRYLKAHASEITTPILLLEAEKDQIVSSQAMADFVDAREVAGLKTEFHCISGAKHELLFEQDAIRNQTLTFVFDFLHKHTKTHS